MPTFSVDALVLAAGKGTRMYSNVPKVLHKVCGSSLLARTISSVSKAKLENLHVVVGHEAELVKAALDKIGVELGLSINPIVQTEQNGTGHAVQVAMPDLSSDAVLILPGDVPLLEAETLASLVEKYNSSKADIAFLTFCLDDPAQFGRVLRDESGQVQLIREAKDCSDSEIKINELNSGIYLINRELLGRCLGSLNTDNAQGELYLTDVIEMAVKEGKTVEAHIVEDAEQLAGANNQLELAELEREAFLRNIRRHQLAGLRAQAPEQTFVEEGVSFGKDCYLASGVQISAGSKIGDNVSIESGAVIKNSSIGSGSTIKAGSYVVDSTVGPDCNLGPYAHLRPGSVLESDVKVGNFVEVKKSTLKSGAKAGHLSYLGDAVLGERTNVGAGTITCNYDGENKHQTIVGEDSFIGSNTCLVAPVQLGDKSYVGAGSAITKDVPGGALAVARSRQTNKENWKK